MLKTMVVDDEELSVKRLKRLLLESGKVEACHTFLNPAEALEFARTNSIDVAFLDISMPSIGGMTLSARLKELDNSIRVVFATGYQEFAVQAFELNATDYLLKPVSADRLIKTLGRISLSASEDSACPAIEVRLFNGFQLMYGSSEMSPIKLRSPKTEELFAFLVCKGTASRELIVDSLWPGLEPEKALKNLSSNLYYIRKTMEDCKMGHVLQSGRMEVALDTSGIRCDVYEFEQLLREMLADSGRQNWDEERIRKAETLYTGELLKGRTYEWAGEHARRLERSYMELLGTAAANCIMQGELRQALHYYNEILKWDILREDIYFEKIRIYIELGRVYEAKRLYHQLEEMMQRELGAAPDPRIQTYITDATQQ